MTARQRIVAGTAATLTWQATDQNGEPADPGTTTVAVTGSAGTVVLAAGTATTTSDTARTVVIPAQNVDELTVVWTGATATATTYVDVVGGVYFNTAQLRADQLALASQVDYDSAAIFEARAITETMFEQRTDTAFVPRFAVLTTDRTARARRTGIRSVKWAQTVAGDYITDTAELARVVEVEQWGVRCAAHIDRVGVVHGWDVPPPDVRSVAMLYTRHLLAESAASGIDMRAIVQSPPDGQAYGFPTPGRPRFITGIETVDATLRAYVDPTPVRSVRQGGY
jgi:hypothetical protein